jgi:hypothetical protein
LGSIYYTGGGQGLLQQQQQNQQQYLQQQHRNRSKNLHKNTAVIATEVVGGVVPISQQLQQAQLIRHQMERLEGQISDIIVSIEDWLFFLQDLLGLKIVTLRRSVSSKFRC